MRNRMDGIAALVLLALCAIGAYSTSQLPHSREVVGTTSLPVLALVGLVVCALGIFFQSLRPRCKGNALPPWPIIIKVLLYFAFFCVYLWGMTAMGEVLAGLEDFPWQHGGGFAVSTVLFLLFSLWFLGRRNPWELLLIPFLSTACLIVAFGWIFQVMLP